MPDADLDALLVACSRTFAIAIPELPEPIRQEVTVAYLLCRALDTVEDPQLTDSLTMSKNFHMKIVKVTSKGQVTIPSEARASLGIDEGTYLEVSEEGEEIRLRKVVPVRPLSGDDPIWSLIGAGESGLDDVAREHDQHLAKGEIARWRESS